ncbi:hypothetical protein ACFQ1S_00425 [Kibdelosporangium lantanae]|uniref:Uncharacterized protein n=1 Tax=Kibdelosporangium lantanae TaxID=1497396 RepID=A0ABW3M2L7_9PSEU
MNDSDLALIARLSFVRCDLESFVFSVLSSIDRSFTAVEWPDNEAALGRQLRLLGRTLELHAETRAVSLIANGQPKPTSDDPT